MSEKYELIDVEKATVTETGEKKYTITTMCGWLEVSTSGYYEWRDRPEENIYVVGQVMGSGAVWEA